MLLPHQWSQLEQDAEPLVCHATVERLTPRPGFWMSELERPFRLSCCIRSIVFGSTGQRPTCLPAARVPAVPVSLIKTSLEHAKRS